jgi:hypothetical protein
MENTSRSSLCRAARSALSLAVAAALSGQTAHAQGSTPANAPHPPDVVAPGCLALIVGIDSYAQPDDASNQLSPLKGASNDAARAKELLLGRFGLKL